MAFCAARPCVSRALARPSLAVRAGQPNWLPGSPIPAHLDGTLPADYGFDPLNLAAAPGNMSRLRESELIHCRWAMTGVVGCLFVELLGFGNWYDAPTWAITGATATYFGVPVPFDVKTIILIELVAMAGVEVLRNEQDDLTKRQYPGGAFDPMGFSKDESKLVTMKKKEIANGRLAMLAFMGFVSQHYVTGKGPLENLFDHLSNPAANNFATNGVSLPQFAFPFLY